MPRYIFGVMDPKTNELIEFVTALLNSDGDAVEFVYERWDPRFVDIMVDGKFLSFARFTTLNTQRDPKQ